MKTEQKKILIERTTDKCYAESEYTIDESILVLNNELEDGKTIFIDNIPFNGTEITSDDLSKVRKKICVTNKLVGG
jgi:hypothetical protein